MNESDLLDRLRFLTDPPVEPSADFREALLQRLRVEFEAAPPDTLKIGPAEDVDGETIAAHPRRGVRRSRPPILAGAAAFVLVIGVGVLIPLLWSNIPDQSAATTDQDAVLSIPGPLPPSVGDVLWPPTDTAGTPISVALMFAEEVLGWSQATAVATEVGSCETRQIDRATCSIYTTTVVLSQPGVEPLAVSMRSIGENESGRLWAVVEVGSGYPTELLEPAPGIGTRIALPPVDGAVSADIGLTIANHESQAGLIFSAVAANSGHLASGFVDTDAVPDRERVLNIFVRYRDASSYVIAGLGGPFNHSYEWSTYEPAGEEVTIADGDFLGLAARLSAFYTTSGDLCVRLGGMACVADPRPGPHIGVLMTATTGTEPGGEWCAFGVVRDAATVELRMPDESTMTAAIYTNPNFDFDFFVHCDVGRRPAQAVGLDAAGNVIDGPLPTP